jgi:hypothetical protein
MAVLLFMVGIYSFGKTVYQLRTTIVTNMINPSIKTLFITIIVWWICTVFSIIVYNIKVIAATIIFWMIKTHGNFYSSAFFKFMFAVDLVGVFFS